MAVHSRSIVAYVVVRTYLSVMYVSNPPRTFFWGGGGGGDEKCYGKDLSDRSGSDGPDYAVSIRHPSNQVPQYCKKGTLHVIVAFDFVGTNN